MSNLKKKELNFNFKGKNAIVIGGTSGIGASVVEKLVVAGANVIFCGANIEKGDKLLNTIKKENNSSHLTFHVCDVTDQENVNIFFNYVFSQFSVLNFIFNNAGISDSLTPFEDTTIDNIEHVMQVNFFGLWRSLKKEIDYILKNHNSASIVNMASTAGTIGSSLNMSSYVSSKHALVGLTKSLALEYAKRNIRINAICPGFVETAMIADFTTVSPRMKKILPRLQPMGRLGTPNEISDYVLFLLSKNASFITGACNMIDGGLTA